MCIKQLFFTALIFSLSAATLQAQQVSETGIAAYYADKLHGKKTSSGELYDKFALTAAHYNLPINSRIRVTRLDNNQSVEVRVNDCCLPAKGRIVDLSRAAAESIDLVKAGTAQVRVDVLTVGDGKKCGAATAAATPTATPKAYSAEGDRLTVKGATPPSSPPPGIYRAEVLRPINTGFGVQVGAYSALANAEAQVDALKKKGLGNLLINFTGAGAKVPYKVIVGQFDTQAAAANHAKELNNKYKVKGMVVSLKE